MAEQRLADRIERERQSIANAREHLELSDEVLGDIDRGLELAEQTVERSRTLLPRMALVGAGIAVAVGIVIVIRRRRRSRDLAE